MPGTFTGIQFENLFLPIQSDKIEGKVFGCMHAFLPVLVKVTVIPLCLPLKMP